MCLWYRVGIGGFQVKGSSGDAELLSAYWPF